MTFKATLAASIAAALLAACGGGDATMAGAPAQGKKQGAAAADAPVHVFPGLREEYRISYLGDATAVTLKSNQQQTVQVPVDATLRFDDSSAVFGKANSAARILRLYQAAFGRAPDAAGLRYWMGVLEQGEPLDAIAAAFAASAEYQDLHGKSPTAEATVGNLYKNVLRREGDAAGYAYWLGILNQGIATAPQVLASFSESPENQEATRNATENGVALLEAGVVYKPVARPGPSQVVLAGNVVQLDGKASSGSGKLTYRWSMASRPAGSKAVLSVADSATPTFTPDVAGDYRLALVVGDGVSLAKEASLQVTARVIPEVWKAAEGKVPTSGNYVYLEGKEGEYVVGNLSYLYKQSDIGFGLHAVDNVLFVNLRDGYQHYGNPQNWTGIFKLPGLGAPGTQGTRLEPGYYGGMKLLSAEDNGSGGMHWLNERRSCNWLAGWFVIDKVRYNGSALAAIDLRFEQHCAGGSSAMHGQIHWDASDTTGVPVPVLPVPAGLWAPSISAPAGNYIDLESTPGDEVGAGKTYLHTEAAGAAVSISGTEIDVIVKDRDSGDTWYGLFAGMSSLIGLKPGYYGDLSRYPYHKAVKGGMDWGGNGRGCSTASGAGWFVIDNVIYAGGTVKTLDARFEHRCGTGASPLYGKIHWSF